MAGTVTTAERIIMHGRRGAMGGVLTVERDGNGGHTGPRLGSVQPHGVTHDMRRAPLSPWSQGAERHTRHNTHRYPAFSMPEHRVCSGEFSARRPPPRVCA